MNKELKKIIEKYGNCRKNVFSKHKKEILLLRENCVTLKGILEYLFKKDKELEKRYEKRIDTALAHLSRTIRYWQKIDTKSNIKEDLEVSQPAPTIPSVKETKRKEIKNEKSEVKTDNTDDVLDEDMLNVINAYKQN